MRRNLIVDGLTVISYLSMRYTKSDAKSGHKNDRAFSFATLHIRINNVLKLLA